MTLLIICTTIRTRRNSKFSREDIHIGWVVTPFCPKNKRDKVNETEASRDETRMAIQIEKSKIIENPYKPYAQLHYLTIVTDVILAASPSP